jgi:arginine-tRNA-protein transferase
MFDGTTAPPLIFVRTMPMSCPYIKGQVERRLVTDISTVRGRKSHDLLANAGFRRTQHISYKPACPNCNACKPIRDPKVTKEQFTLFQTYQNSRHNGGDMGLMDFVDFGEMVERSPIETKLLEYRKGSSGELVAVMLVDIQNNGFSAVYSFFDVREPNRSLGTFLVLSLISEAMVDGLDYIYLGYWIEDSSKMSYKTRFSPAEILTSDGWITHINMQ